MKKTEITFDEWQEAERRLVQINAEPKPEGSITAEDYAKNTKRSVTRARQVLSDMIKAGLVTRRWWRSEHGTFFVYFLNGSK